MYLTHDNNKLNFLTEERSTFRNKKNSEAYLKINVSEITSMFKNIASKIKVLHVYHLELLTG